MVTAVSNILIFSHVFVSYYLLHSVTWSVVDTELVNSDLNIQLSADFWNTSTSYLCLLLVFLT